MRDSARDVPGKLYAKGADAGVPKGVEKKLMNRIHITLGLMAAVTASAAVAAPHFPTITQHKFKFDALNDDEFVAYATNGTAPDTLTYIRQIGDHESISYRPDGEDGEIFPIWDEVLGPPVFGGDFYMAVQFVDQDAPFGDLDVSLIGTGANTEPGAADLEIYGTLDLGGGRGELLQGLLWAVDLESVSLFGISDNEAYGVDGIGTVVGGLLAELVGVVGEVGAVRGQLDFVGAPAGWITPFYNPTDDVALEVAGNYSGDTGVVPEPASLMLVLLSVGCWRRR